MRHRDIHLLTVGRYTYTSDQRFEALHSPHTEDWTLRIRYPQRKDSGIYECQISTTPPIGHPVYLTIVGEQILILCNIYFYFPEVGKEIEEVTCISNGYIMSTLYSLFICKALEFLISFKFSLRRNFKVVSLRDVFIWSDINFLVTS